MRDDLSNTVFHSCAEHIPIEKPEEEVQAEGQVGVESVDFSSKGTKPEDSDTKMVVRQTMTADRFLPSGRQTSP